MLIYVHSFNENHEVNFMDLVYTFSRKLILGGEKFLLMRMNSSTGSTAPNALTVKRVGTSYFGIAQCQSEAPVLKHTRFLETSENCNVA